LKNFSQDAQEWLESQEAYNTKEKRAETIELGISNEFLGNELNLSDFVNLEVLDCSNNQLTNLNLNNCQKLKEIKCSFNKLTNLDLTGLGELEIINCNDNYLSNFEYSVPNPDKLIDLDIRDNNLPKQDLKVFTKFINLKTL